jgi:hypothetical protein
MKKKTKYSKATIEKTSVKIVLPSNNNWVFYTILCLSFIVNFTLYLLTLAPSVTFEDSGEFITAAYNLGVCHEPGYPLFTMLGKLFTIIIPFGSIAFRTNLSSAVYSSISTVFLTSAMVLILEDIFTGTAPWRENDGKIVNIIKYISALTVGILYGTSSKLWDQSVITGVKGLNSLFVALFLLLVVLWQRQENADKKRRIFYAVSFILGLTLTNHTTSAALIPLFGFYVLITQPKIFLDFKLMTKAFVFFLIGLLPLLYLPIASSSNPVLNWGDPENLTNFIRVLTRHQYWKTTGQTAERFFAQSSVYFKEFLIDQWVPFIPLFAFVGLYPLWKYSRKFFWFILAFLFFTIPVTTYLTDFDVTASPFVSNENKALVSAFYVPSYLVISVLIGIGMFYCGLTFKWKRHILAIFSAFAIIIFSVSIPGNYIKNDMSKYHFPQIYKENLFRIAGPGALIVSNWDPFSFPLFYYQFVENNRKDIISLDIELLKRSWYLHNLKAYRNESLIAPSAKEVTEFLASVQPFEDDERFDGNVIQQKYEAMIASFIDNALQQGREVYFTFVPKESYLRRYQLESVLAAYKVVMKNQELTDVKYDDFNFSDYFDKDIHHDRMANYVKDFYGNAILSRAYLLENNGRINDAVDLYKKYLSFANDNQTVLNIERRLSTLEKNK